MILTFDKSSILLTCITFLQLVSLISSVGCQSEFIKLKSDPFYIDLFHKFGPSEAFLPRGSIIVRPRTEFKPSQVSYAQQPVLSEADKSSLRQASEQGSTYYLRAQTRTAKGGQNRELKTTETTTKACSIYLSNLEEFIQINLTPSNEFLSVNLYTTDPECKQSPPSVVGSEFNSTILVDSGQVGPQPDTATYIKRLEEERQSKLKDGKEDNRSFFAKYWIYIVPAVVILMMLGGPEQAR